MSKNHKCNFPPRQAKGNWKCKFCNEVFRVRRDMEKHRHEKHPEYNAGPHNKGGRAWNKGLTKETSQLIKAMSKKNSEYFKANPPPGIASTIEGENIRRSKLSKIRSELNEKIQGGNGGRPDVKWYKVQNLNNVEFTVRGKWELNVAKRLNELGILWIKNQRISYMKDGVKKWYNPDFYLPISNEYIEVKGWFKDEDKIKMNLVCEQYPTYRIYFINSDWYNKFIDNGSLIEDMIFRRVI